MQAFTIQTAQMHLKMTLRCFRYLAVWVHKQVARDKLRHRWDREILLHWWQNNTFACSLARNDWEFFGSASPSGTLYFSPLKHFVGTCQFQWNFCNRKFVFRLESRGSVL